MVNVEVVLMVLVAFAALVLLALAVSSGPVSHMDSHEPEGGRVLSPPARPWSGTASVRPVPSRSATRRRRAAAVCTRSSSDWTRLMEPVAHRSTPTKAER